MWIEAMSSAIDFPGLIAWTISPIDFVFCLAFDLVLLPIDILFVVF